mgnify:CR=1 FL=1
MVSLAPEFPNDNPELHRGVIWVCLEPTGPARPERLTPDAPPEPVRAWTPEEDEDTSAPILVEELEPIEASVEGTPVPIADARAAPDERAPETAPSSLPELLTLEVEAEDEVEVEAEAEAESGVILSASFEELVDAGAVPKDSTELPAAPDDPFTVLVCTLADIAIGAGAAQVAALLPGLLFDGRISEPLDAGTADALRGAGILDGTEVASTFVATTHAWRAILRGTSEDFSACGAAMLDEWASQLLATLLVAPAKTPTLRQELRARGVAAFGLVEAAA